MPRPSLARWLAPLLLLLATPLLLACLWDYDTLRDERRGLPGIAEVLAGKWERHSAYFYEQRVAKMKQLIAAEPGNLAAYDNLAVAHEKLGDPAAAIAVMERKEKLKPGGYTTYANLGTFHLHTGDFDGGIKYIERALAINPEAHFGREEYQLRLAKYLRDIRASGKEAPAEDFLGISFFRTKKDGTLEAETVERAGPDLLAEKGLKPNVFDGIVGMIRFGTGKSPDLYYALGNLLTLRGDKHLAYRAYDRAVEFGHPHAESIKVVMERLDEHRKESGARPGEIERERAEAAKWVAAYQRYEDDLLRAGKDVDDEANYAAFYKRHGTAQASLGFAVGDVLPRDRVARKLLVLGGVLVALLLAAVFAVRAIFRWRRRSRGVGVAVG